MINAEAKELSTSPHLLYYLRQAAFGPAGSSRGLCFLDRQENETPVDYHSVWERAQRAAANLHAAGIRKGDCVAIILPTCPEFMDAFFGLQMLAAVPVPLYPPVRLGRMDEYYAKTAAMLRTVQARAIISSGMVNRVIGKVLPLYSPELGIIKADKLHSGPLFEPADSDADTLAMIQFSSGTTVAPKAVALTHRQVVSNSLAIVENLLLAIADIEPPVEHKLVSWLPLYHDMGLIGCLFSSIVAQAQLYLISPEIFLSRPAIWLRAISRYRAAGTVAPNFAFGLCTERVSDADIADCDFSDWHIALCGAEPVSPRIMRDFAARFASKGFRFEALTPVYGLSEASLALTFSDGREAMRSLLLDREALALGRASIVDAQDCAAEQQDQAQQVLELVSLGKALNGFAVEIRDADGHRLAEDQVGLIYGAGPSLCDGYYNSNESPIENGWLNTGDLGFLHDGELYITGRAKDVIIINGRNHAPQDIEQVLDEVNGVRIGCSAAVAMQDDDGEKLLLFVEYRKLRDELAEDCRRMVLKRCQLDPHLVVLLEPGTLPRTSSGKIRRAEALRLWQSGELTPPEKVTPLLLAGVMAASFSARVANRFRRRSGK